MKENNKKETTQIEKNVLQEIKSVLKKYMKENVSIKEEIVVSNFEAQNKVNNIKTLKVDAEKYKIKETLSPESEQKFKQSIIEKIETAGQKQEERLRKKLYKTRDEANSQCKMIIRRVQRQLKDKVKEEKRKLEEMKKELKLSKTDLASIKKALSGLGPKPDDRIFTMLDKERGQIIEKRKEMSKKKRIITQNIKKAEEELNEFNSKFGRIRFYGEKGIEQLLSMIYGRLADYSIFIQEDEWNEELEKSKRENEEDKEEDKEKNKPEQGERKEQKAEEDVNKKPEDKTKPEQEKKKEHEKQQEKGEEAKTKPEQEAKKQQEKGQEDKTKTEQEEAKKQQGKEQEAKVKPEQDTKTQQEKNEQPKPTKRLVPKMKYVANRNEYIINDNEEGVVKLTSKEFSNSITKKELAEIMEVSEEALEYVDTNAVHAWMKYDKKNGTHEAMKYLKNMLDPENLSKENRQDIEYDLTKIGKAKELSRARKREILAYSNYAKEYNIANVKKGFRDTIKEKIARVFNRNKLAENNRKSTEREGERRPKQRENKLYKEMTVKDKYYEISQSIAQAKESELDGILVEARKDLREGKISITEYNGLAYNASNRRATINMQPQDIEADSKREAVFGDERE